ncbi:hypothetical protein TNCT6_38990 [Streptomyces sp. 6-11-2]|nr:hypothetical protein TNCT6_38990 [Streptomyces sp. 6-11-2]
MLQMPYRPMVSGKGRAGAVVSLIGSDPSGRGLLCLDRHASGRPWPKGVPGRFPASPERTNLDRA